jgi:hypothetical protein
VLDLIETAPLMRAIAVKSETGGRFRVALAAGRYMTLPPGGWRRNAERAGIRPGCWANG